MYVSMSRLAIAPDRAAELISAAVAERLTAAAATVAGRELVPQDP